MCSPLCAAVAKCTVQTINFELMPQVTKPGASSLDLVFEEGIVSHMKIHLNGKRHESILKKSVAAAAATQGPRKKMNKIVMVSSSY